MKYIKSLMVGLIVSGASVAFGQQAEIERDRKSEKEIKKMDQIIPGLSEKQKEEIEKAHLEYYANAKKLKNENREHRGRTHQERAKLKKEVRNNYKQILTQEQYIALLEHRFDKKEKKRFRRGDREKNNKRYRGHSQKRLERDKD